jgi:hypothetical protein
MKNIILIFLILALLCGFTTVLNAQTALGYLKVQGDDGPLNLRVISVAEAQAAGNGVVKIALPGGVIGAADLVATSNANASAIRINTSYGVRSWRKENLYSYVYGGTGSDLFTGMALTSDGGLALGGYTNSWGAGLNDQLLIKTNISGTASWSGVYGDAQSETGQSVIQRSDGGYLILGTASSGGEFYMYLNFINSTGSSTQSGYFQPSTGYSAGYDVIQCTDGNFAAVGYVTGFGAGGYDAYVKKFNGSGGNIWGYAIGSTYDEVGKEIVQRADGGYAIAGYVTTQDYGYDVYFLMIDSDGVLEIAYSAGGSDADYAEAICKAADNGFVMFGRTWSFGAGEWDYYLIKRSSAGNYLWGRAIGSTGSELGEDIALTDDGGFILTGKTDGFGAGGIDVWLVKTDSLGWPQWSWVFGGEGNDAGYAVRQGPDGCYYVAGISSSYGAGGNDALLVKFAQDGSACLGFAVGFNSEMQAMDANNSPFKAQRVDNFSVMDVKAEEKKIPASVQSIRDEFIQKPSQSRDLVTPTVTTVCD